MNTINVFYILFVRHTEMIDFAEWVMFEHYGLFDFEYYNIRDNVPQYTVCLTALTDSAAILYKLRWSQEHPAQDEPSAVVAKIMFHMARRRGKSGE